MKKVVVFITMLLAFTAIKAQEAKPTLEEKWESMLEKAETYQHYKVIKKTDLKDVWKSVQDSIVRFKTELVQERKKITGQQAQIESLQKEVTDLKSRLNSITKEKDSMTFMGGQVDKYSYASALWVIIAIVAIGCGILFFLFQNAHRVTRQKIKKYEDLFTEFEEHKKLNLEKERKLKRELQTQVNLIEELKSSSRRS